MAEAKKTTAKKKTEEAEVAATALEVVEDAPAEVVETETAAPEEEAETKASAKAGKRSDKSLKEAEAKEAKEERKASGEVSDKPKQHSNPTRSRLARRGKKFQELAKLLEVGKAYPLDEAAALAQKTSPTKFDATVELHINLGVDPRHADQNIRDNLVLPAGTGKTVRIAVLTEDADAALKAGADIAGTDELFKELDKGQMNFDILISTPQLMAKLGKYARALGPRGLMPNPKSGTVTNDVAKAVAEAKAGRVEFRVDSTGIVHLGVGKVSFTTPQLLENISAVFASIKAAKPASVKGTYLKTAYLTTSMGPVVPIDLNSIS